VLHIGGEVGYTVGDKFSLTSGLTFNQFNSLKDNDRAWGLIPLEWRTSLRLQVLRDLYVKSDLYAFDGPRFLEKDGSRGNLKGALDLNAGLEFKIVKNISLWAQFNNIFNMQYQRWHQYPVYPFSFIGGVVFSFDQNTR
jgi:outer membrane receptor protein involved in Fe transport